MIDASVITLVVYSLVLVILAGLAVFDMRTRRIPNGVTGGLVVLWLAWRLALGGAGVSLGLGFDVEFFGPAPDVTVPPGLDVTGISLASGLVGAVVLGGGLLVLTTAFEMFARKESFGGGDIKLMAALGLFLGVERGFVCLLAACLLSLLVAAVRVARTRADGGSRSWLQREDEGHEAIGEGGGARGPRAFLDASFPFAPFIALGTLVAFVV